MGESPGDEPARETSIPPPGHDESGRAAAPGPPAPGPSSVPPPAVAAASDGSAAGAAAGAAESHRVIDDLVFLQGVSATKQTLREWNKHPWPVIRSWLALSVGIAIVLLAAVYVVARSSIPDPTPVIFAGFNRPADLDHIGFILFRNSLVLALHAFACVAGFIAGNSLPYSAARRHGLSRWVHEKAGPLAIGFVGLATLFSLSTQAYFIGNVLASGAAQLGISDLHLLLLLLPHAIPELTALFLPLAAWLIASRRDDWDQLLAATFVTVAIAVPVLVCSAVIEVTVFPDLLRAATGT